MKDDDPVSHLENDISPMRTGLVFERFTMHLLRKYVTTVSASYMESVCLQNDPRYIQYF